ncbi:MAG: hypothetical protein KDA61_14170, partial [Planctomycetales bacterium]|nr:hypothetical protein [Planctomycetales bacterium]
MARELISLELELRRKRGEAPEKQEYLARFPQLSTVVDDLFGVEWATQPTPLLASLANRAARFEDTERSAG